MLSRRAFIAGSAALLPVYAQARSMTMPTIYDFGYTGFPNDVTPAFNAALVALVTAGTSFLHFPEGAPYNWLTAPNKVEGLSAPSLGIFGDGKNKTTFRHCYSAGTSDGFLNFWGQTSPLSKKNGWSVKRISIDKAPDINGNGTTGCVAIWARCKQDASCNNGLIEDVTIGNEPGCSWGTDVWWHGVNNLPSEINAPGIRSCVARNLVTFGDVRINGANSFDWDGGSLNGGKILYIGDGSDAVECAYIKINVNAISGQVRFASSAIVLDALIQAPVVGSVYRDTPGYTRQMVITDRGPM